MPLTNRQRSQLMKVIAQVNKILSQDDTVAARKIAKRGSSKVRNATKLTNGTTRKRRSATEMAKLRKTIHAERRRGVSVSKLAEKYGVSKPYIYAIKQ